VKPVDRIALIGVGAVGGSIGGALRAQGLAGEVRGFDPVNGEAARRAGLIDRVAGSLEEAVQGAAIVILAAPVQVNCALLGDPRLRTALAPTAAGRRPLGSICCGMRT
jgi:prephenate dehydrogenase